MVTMSMMSSLVLFTAFLSPSMWSIDRFLFIFRPSVSFLNKTGGLKLAGEYIYISFDFYAGVA